MMFKRLFFLLIVSLAVLACTDSSSSVSLVGHVRGTQYEGKQVYLTQVDSVTAVLDSALIQKQQFKLDLGDSLRMYNLLLRTNASDQFPIILPIIGGEGKVEVYLGDKVVTTGTPSNDALQDFLLASDQVFDKLINSDATVEQVKTEFNKFLTSQVKLNQNSIVSVYILLTFKSKFTEEEFSDMKMLVPARFKCLLP